jgi:hypothetical protein
MMRLKANASEMKEEAYKNNGSPNRCYRKIINAFLGVGALLRAKWFG